MIFGNNLHCQIGGAKGIEGDFGSKQMSENAPEAALGLIDRWSGHTVTSAVIRALASPDMPMS